MTDSPAHPAPSASTRHDGWTPERQRSFLAALALHGGVAKVAQTVGMTPQSANCLRPRDGAEDFAHAWDAALAEGRQRSYDEAIRIAREGYRSPVTCNGQIVGRRHRHDNRLLFAACDGEPMARYSER